MSHNIDIGGVLEKLVLLQHFSSGSRSYCAERLAGSIQDQGNSELDEYWGWVKGIVCSYTLECSIKLRVLQDSVKKDTHQKQIDTLDENARQGLLLAVVIVGDFELTLRELSNKIIHATRVVPEWESGYINDIEFKFWNGTLALSGERNGKPWELKLHTFQWALAMQRFLSSTDSEDTFMYVGQDWFPK